MDSSSKLVFELLFLWEFLSLPWTIITTTLLLVKSLSSPVPSQLPRVGICDCVIHTISLSHQGTLSAAARLFSTGPPFHFPERIYRDLGVRGGAFWSQTGWKESRTFEAKMFSRVARRQLAAERQLLARERRGTPGHGRLFSTTVSRRADFAHVVSELTCLSRLFGSRWRVDVGWKIAHTMPAQMSSPLPSHLIPRLSNSKRLETKLPLHKMQC